MLSYRHAFHAGNHADVLKHLTLFAVLTYYTRKDKPFWYIDTHAGAGVYDLGSMQAQKVGEYRSGIGRLAQAQDLPPVLAAFVAHGQTMRLPESDATLYPGSPWLGQSLLRDDDRLRLFERHPQDFALLQQSMAQSRRPRRTVVSDGDGFSGLLSLLPPPPRRAVVLMDPPYEQKQDYRRAVDTLAAALKKFATGCYLLWYPCLSRAESSGLPDKLQRLRPEHYLRAELHVRAPAADGFGMHGSGMWLLNPPYTLAADLAAALPTLCALLRQDAGARWVLEHRQV